MILYKILGYFDTKGNLKGKLKFVYIGTVLLQEVKLYYLIYLSAI